MAIVREPEVMPSQRGAGFLLLRELVDRSLRQKRARQNKVGRGWSSWAGKYRHTAHLTARKVTRSPAAGWVGVWHWSQTYGWTRRQKDAGYAAPRRRYEPTEPGACQVLRRSETCLWVDASRPFFTHFSPSFPKKAATQSDVKYERT